jgi:hypothetical protein
MEGIMTCRCRNNKNRMKSKRKRSRIKYIRGTRRKEFGRTE